ncbi:MAG: hypothetical protein O2960_05195 [Verrucomicrobia bacterium]|nr:hypothetical protein [Verrucomicrobiota bacterium]
MLAFPITQAARFRLARLACLSALLSGSLHCVGANAAGDRSEGGSPVERFKAFISSPPVIKDIVFRKKVRQDLSKPMRMDGSFALSTNFEYFHARWQPDATLLRQIPDPSDIESLKIDRLLVSIFRDEYWLVDRERMATHWFKRSETDNFVFRIANRRMYSLRKLLNLGLIHVPIASIVWNGNTFLVNRTLVSEEIKEIRGELFAKGTNRPTELRVKYAGPRSYAEHVVRYAYETEFDELPFLPSKISTFYLNDGREVEVDEMTIVELDTAKTPLGTSAFDPQPFIDANKIGIGAYTNDALYSVTADGHLEFVRSYHSETPSFFSRRITRSAERIFLYASWVGANVGIFFVFRRIRKIHNNQV